MNERAERFAAIYRREHPQVLRFLARRAAPGQAQDVAHEAFLVAWRRLDDIPVNPPDTRAWLFTVARNCLLNQRRGAARHDALTVRIADHTNDCVASAESAVIERADLRAAWNALTATDQEVISLTVWEDLTSAQAGRILGISSAAYRLRLHRARSALRRLLDPGPEPASRPALTTVTHSKEC